MWNYIAQRIKECPNANIVCSDETEKRKYSDMLDLAEYHGKHLRQMIPQGCKCAIVCNSEYHVAIALLAAWYAQLVPILTSTHYGERHCKAILELTCPDVVLVDSERVLSLEGTPTVYQMTNNQFFNSRDTYFADKNLYDAALIMCTSGTTGKPKGAIITKSGLIHNVLGIEQYFGLAPGETILIARPLYHCAVLTGEFLVSLFNGINIVFFDKPYSPRSIIETCEKNSVTVMCGTPTLFRHISQFLQLEQKQIMLKKIALSGECLTSQHAKRIRNAFPEAEIYNVYGLTEASPRVSYLPPELFNDYPESVGYPLRMTEIRVVDNEGKECRPCERGLIMVKSPSLMKGYYNNQDLTNAVIRNGWLRTGDIGYKDDIGRLNVLSRVDDLIIKGGMNIYPREIENQVLAIDQIEECVAYGYPNGDFQSIGIDIVLKSEHVGLTKKEIKIMLAAHLPQYQIPTQINIVSTLKKNASGKIIRNRQ